MIPYIIMLLLCGLPLLFMELSMGQYTRRGPIGAIGKMCPIFQVCQSVYRKPEKTCQNDNSS